MALHRIHRENQYLIFTIPASEVLKKLGRKYPFHIKRGPDSYIHVWKDPLEIVFEADEDSKGEVVPDLQVMNGRTFFSERTFDALSPNLNQDGEFLPVTYDGRTGYIFNPRVIAENYDALDEKVTVKMNTVTCRTWDSSKRSCQRAPRFSTPRLIPTMAPIVRTSSNKLWKNQGWSASISSLIWPISLEEVPERGTDRRRLHQISGTRGHF